MEDLVLWTIENVGQLRCREGLQKTLSVTYPTAIFATFEKPHIPLQRQGKPLACLPSGGFSSWAYTCVPMLINDN